MAAIGLVRASASSIVRPLSRASPARAARGLDRVLGRARGRARRGAGLRAARDGEVRASARSGRSARSCRCMRVSAFGRGYLDLELAARALRRRRRRRALARPARAAQRRSVAALLALVRRAARGRRGAARSRRRRPRGADGAARARARARLAAPRSPASLWIGGLVGLLVLWRSLPARTARRRPRRRRAALLERRASCRSVLLLGSGVGASVLHLPTLASLWQTSYGKTIIVKAALLLGAMLVASVQPAAHDARAPAAAGAAVGRRGDCSCAGSSAARSLLVAGAVAAAAVLSSLPPPPKALAATRQRERAHGPGPGDADRAPTQRLPARAPRDAEPRRRPERVRRTHRRRRHAGPRRRRDRNLHDAGHGDAAQIVPPRRDVGRDCTSTPRRRSSWSATGDSRSTIQPRGAQPFTRPPPRSGERMRRVAVLVTARRARCLRRSPGSHARTAIRRATTCSGRRCSSRIDAEDARRRSNSSSSRSCTRRTASGFTIRVAVIGSSYDLGVDHGALAEAADRTRDSSAPSCSSSTSTACSS